MNRVERNRIAEEARKVMKDKPKVCVNCGSEENIHIHHIVPVSEGGGNTEGNLVMLCRECHIKAHANVGNRPRSGGGIEYQNKSVLERVSELKDTVKDFRIERPYLFKGFKDYVEMLYNNDPTVMSKDDIATMELLMFYREIGLSHKEFEEWATEKLMSEAE